MTVELISLMSRINPRETQKASINIKESKTSYVDGQFATLSTITTRLELKSMLDIERI